MMQESPITFEEHKIRRVYDERTETWFFSVIDVMQVLIQQPDYQAARNYWKDHDIQKPDEFAILTNIIHKANSRSYECNWYETE